MIINNINFVLLSFNDELFRGDLLSMHSLCFPLIQYYSFKQRNTAGKCAAPLINTILLHCKTECHGFERDNY